MKDNFSEVSREYSRYRPGYPQDLFRFLKAEINCFETAWDCGTGTGQVAVPLSGMFKTVYATDISAAQLKNAPARKNIVYSQQQAENTNFAPKMFDLITVAQAIHWFDFDNFYGEVHRTLKSEGIIALMGYGLVNTNEQTQQVLDYLYNEVLGPYWDPERKFIDENYSTIPFPFREIPTPSFKMTDKWSIHRLIGYLKTWSAVQHFIKKNDYDPVDEFIPELKNSFTNDEKVTFPILLRIGRIL